MTSGPTTPASFEGRLLAQRAALARLITLLPDDARAAMLSWLADRSVPRDGQEDPGAVPDPAAATALAQADEYRLLRNAVAPQPDDDEAPPQPI